MKLYQALTAFWLFFSAGGINKVVSLNVVLVRNRDLVYNGIVQRSRFRGAIGSLYYGGRNDYEEKIQRDIELVEPMYSLSYDPLERPNQATQERDLEDMLVARAWRFNNNNLMRSSELCYLVGLEDKSQSRTSDDSQFTLEESLTELSELAGAAGLTVVGSTYQRVVRPNVEYYIGPGKTKEIQKAMAKLKCTCVIFDTELTPSQQKNLELSFNQQQQGSADKIQQKCIKVVDRTALILDIFAQHARTKEGQLQVIHA